MAEENVVVEVGRRGKLVVGEPYFTPGTPIVLDRSGAQEARPGDLVVVSYGRRPKVERVLGPATSIEAVLGGWLVETGNDRGFPRLELRDPSREERVDLRDPVTFTIDPEAAQEFDRGLSLRRDGDGL